MTDIQHVAVPVVERTAFVNGVELSVQTLGDPADPPVLLVMGALSSMLRWEDGFCERLAAGGRYVIRYDQRDTGRSTHFPAGAPPYGVNDLVEDAVGLLDALGLDEAHVVGVSMGGMIAQLAALDHPDRIASLTLLSTSPGGPGPHNPDLPNAAEEFLAVMSGATAPDWSDRTAVSDFFTGIERVGAGASRYFDEDEMRELADRIFDRDRRLGSCINHFVMDRGEPFRARLSELDVPTLVIHGTEDPVFPYAHGVAMASEIRNARLLTIEGMGHQVAPRPLWDTLVPAIVAHTEGF
jgi:pimeloyl-ACP methyl ester carboxylesterase